MNKRMDAGRLDRRLTLRRRTVEPNALNEDEEDFIDLATVWASRHDVSDAERVASKQVAAEITTRFQIRWSANWSDINPKDRVVCEGREYEIISVKEGGRREYIEITACARADQNGLYS